MSMLLSQEGQFLISSFTSWTSIKSWLWESWVSLSWEELPEPSEQPSFPNLILPLLRKLVSLMTSELRKSPLKRLSSSRDQLKIADFQQSSWEEAPETFWKISKEPSMMESMSSSQWPENHHSFRVLAVLKLFCRTSSKLRPKNWQDLTNTVTADSQRLLRFSQEFWLRIQAWMLTRLFQSWLQRTKYNPQDWTYWLEMLRRFPWSKFTITERQRNGPSDLLLNLPSQFWKLIKLSLPSQQEDLRWINKTKLMRRIDLNVVCIMYLSNSFWFEINKLMVEEYKQGV